MKRRSSLTAFEEKQLIKDMLRRVYETVAVTVKIEQLDSY